MLEERRDFKIGVIVMRIELADLTEQLQSFLLVGGGARLACLDLCQQADSFIAVLETSARDHRVQVGLCSLEVAHVELDFGKAEECLII